MQEKAEKDKLLDELMGKPVQKEENAPNPSVAKTEKSPQSEPTSEQPKKSAEGATCLLYTSHIPYLADRHYDDLRGSRYLLRMSI